MQKRQFEVTGMSCSACSARVSSCVNALSGVHKADVNLLTRSMTVVYDEQVLQDRDIIHAVETAGYGARIGIHADNQQGQQESRILKRRFLCSLTCLVPMMMMHHLRQDAVSLLLQALLLLPILILNRRFFLSGFKAVKHRAPNMDTLIALGAGAGIVYSIFEVFFLHRGVVYIEAAGMILTLITFGKWLEARATGHTGTALEKLRALMPDTATLLHHGAQVVIPAADIRPGQILLIKPGEKIPADAMVTEGYSGVDESAFSGESMPVEKAPGSPVYAGTINGNGALQVKVCKSREDSALSGIISMVSEASTTKAPIARIADRVSGIFVTLVVIISALTAALWSIAGCGLSNALGYAIAVLVVSCPCALGLATPVAIMVGAGVGARHGILFRNGEALEKAGSITAVILDKTGTLTAGHPRVCDIIPIEGERSSILSTAAALEAANQHPLADAVTRAAEGIPHPDAAEVSYQPGLGIRGQIHGIPCAIGNAELMQQLGICTAAIPAADRDKTILYIARGSRLLGVITIADEIREEAAESVALLRCAGRRVMMMTGDTAETAAAIAHEAGIDEVFAGVKPEDKASMVQKLRREGYCVAMVGDGINDAPALTRADVGIAIGAGTDVAIESAGIILLRSELRDIHDALRLSKAAMRTIRQNLFWAFCYNILMIPLAAGAAEPLCGLTISPGIAAAAMSLSSLCVVLNALRLNRFRFTPSSSSPKSPMNTIITLRVTGMMCPHCERHMTEAFLALPEVIACTANHRENTVTLELSTPCDDTALAITVSKAGYTYEGIIS